ncbi:hypothetical protein C3Z06_26945 [Cupriavidus metallidurans]|nr:hypothetical protein C3Z06_26945 [Cupriavidus metallidurans]
MYLFLNSECAPGATQQNGTQQLSHICDPGCSDKRIRNATVLANRRLYTHRNGTGKNNQYLSRHARPYPAVRGQVTVDPQGCIRIIPAT